MSKSCILELKKDILCLVHSLSLNWLGLFYASKKIKKKLIKVWFCQHKPYLRLII